MSTRAGDALLRNVELWNAAAILAAVELGRRLTRVPMLSVKVLDEPKAVAAYLTLRYSTPDQEVVGALYFDKRRHLIAEREIFRGTLSRAAVEPGVILRSCTTAKRERPTPLPHTCVRRSQS